MRVVQVLSSLSPGDGVGNDCLAIRKALIEEGLGTQIYAESISPKISKGIALPISHINEIKSDDIMIYHLAIGTELNFKIDQIQCKKVLRYHNITPGEFFYGYSRDTRNACSYGLKGVRFLADKMDYGLAVSEFNKKDLLKMGYKCPIEVMPILIPFSDYEKEADEHIIKKYSDGNTNIMFLGRISPNKRQEDIIRAFYLYKKYYDANARLFLVGSYAGMEKYYERLLEYIERLNLKDVYFTGHIPFSHILAYYRTANVFLCMSEHEGFCIPLVEAMYFGVPIIAYDKAAIKDTLNGSGILVKEKDYLLIAGIIDRLVKDIDFRKNIINGQKKRCQDFQYTNIKKILMNFLKKIE